MRPVIGISACNRSIGTETGQAVMNRYARAAMKYADVAALLIPAMPDFMDASEVVGRLDGILLTGSPSNVEPSRYGQTDGAGPFDPRRDEVALNVINRMIDAGKPVFGICRGFQEINVALGGSLRRDVSQNDEFLLHHSANETDLDIMFDHYHGIDLTPGGMMAKATGKTEMTVNSVHFQGIDRLADGVQVEARARDGLVESFSARPNGAPLLAVQWHPEWDADENADSKAFFAMLGNAARREL